MDKVLVLHSAVAEGAGKDELDVLDQAKVVFEALCELGYEPTMPAFDGDMVRLEAIFREVSPRLVFNLVETVHGSGRLIHWAPSWIEIRGCPHTGSSAEALRVTSNKLEAKVRMRAAGLPTPDWRTCNVVHEDALNPTSGKWIVKSVWEHASMGLTSDSVIESSSPEELRGAMMLRKESLGGECFAERYIDGREFNLSILSGSEGPMVLPVAEIRFDAFPDEKLRIVDYRAKWEEDSFEFQHTPRTFDIDPHDEDLVNDLESLALKCWRLFNLNGYARVDFRVDAEGRPWILEVNANPCIAPAGGFVAAAVRAGLSFRNVVGRILDDPVMGMPEKRQFHRKYRNFPRLPSIGWNKQEFPRMV
jgi:D-alanine-D-alanine ligase